MRGYGDHSTLKHFICNMISKKAVQDYLRKQTESWDWIKSCSIEELDEAAQDLDNVPEQWDGARIHQKAMFLLGAKMPHFMFLGDMGVGKTYLSLALIRYHMRNTGVKKTLVLVPFETSMYEWVDQARQHTPDLRVVALRGSTEERWEILGEDHDIYVLNYQGLPYLAGDMVKKKKKKGSEVKLSTSKINKLKKKFQCFIFDESTSIKNHMSITFRACSRISVDAKVRYGLTGTPHGRNPQDLWAQFFVTDRGETLGETLGMFREGFFLKKDNIWSGGHTFKFNKRMEDKLNKRIKHRSIRYRVDECLDLPDKVFKQVRVKLPFQNLSHYEKLKTYLESVRGDQKEVKNTFIRARQIASGYASLQDEDEDKIEVVFKHNPKLDALESLVESVPEDKKFVVVYEYNMTGDLIERMLKSKKIKGVRLWGQTKDKIGTIRQFKENKDVKYLLVNWKSGSKSLNLQMANYMMLVETPVSSIEREQLLARIWRGGQTQTCFFYDLIASGTVDEKIQEYLTEGGDLMGAIVDGTVKL